MKTKNKPFLAIFLCCAVLQLAGQGTGGFVYKPLAEFNGDTLNYIRYNFIANKSHYVGQPTSLLFEHLEPELKSYLYMDTNDTQSIVGFYLSFLDKDETGCRSSDNRKMVELIISFENYLPTESLRGLYADRTPIRDWIPQVRTLFGNQVISDVAYIAYPRYCDRYSPYYDAVKCAQAKCNPRYPDFDPVNCTNSTVSADFNFNNLLDNSPNGNNFTLQDGATISNSQLILGGGENYDYMHPHARVANSPSLNPQYITVAARLSPQDFVGCGNDAIVNKPYTSHNNPYYQYHLGIGGSYNTAGYDHIFGFCASVNGQYDGVNSYPLKWVPGLWYTVVGVYDGANYKLYVNGILVNSKAYSGTLDSFDTNLFIGKQGNLNNSIPANIEWVKVYSRALSDVEVEAINGL